MKRHPAPAAPAAGTRRLVALLLTAGMVATALGLHDTRHDHERDRTGAADGELIASCSAGHPRSEHFEAPRLVRSPPCPACWLSDAGLGDAGDTATTLGAGDGGSQVRSGSGPAAAGNSRHYPSPRGPPSS